MTFQMLHRLIKVVNFQHQVGTIARWLEEWFIADTQRVRTDLLLDVELVAINHSGCAFGPENILIESTGTFQIRGRINNEGKFDNFHGRYFIWQECSLAKSTTVCSGRDPT